MTAAPAEPEADAGRRVPLTRMRRAVARSMTASAAVPQFSIEIDARLGALARLREELAKEGIAISYSDVLTAAVATALAAHPSVNASWDDDAIVEHAEVNVGIAVSLPDGLIAPAIRAADTLSLPQIREERERLSAAAHAGELTPGDILSATFTISNLGPLGVRRFRALVVPPQAAILAVGALGDGDELSLSLSCDHRVLDGVPAARFLTDVGAALETPAWVAARTAAG